VEVKLLSQNDLKMTLEDIRAFDKVLTLIKEFSDKNPIRKETINYAKIKTQIQSLEEVISRTNQLDNAILTGILKKMKSIIKASRRISTESIRKEKSVTNMFSHQTRPLNKRDERTSKTGTGRQTTSFKTFLKASSNLSFSCRVLTATRT
jgi:hypothetical protein